MSRIGRILPLGVALVLASCADGTGPPLQPDEHPLGSVIGPGVSAAELHPLKHRMSMVLPGDMPVFHVVAQSADEAPQLDAYELSFCAKHGELRDVVVNYVDDNGTGTGRFLHFTVPPTALLTRPDGTPFTSGDSVLISLSINQSEVIVEFGPSGLVFDENTPAVLEMWYDGADDDDQGSQEQLGIWHQQDAGELWFPIESAHNTEQKRLKTHVFHFSTYAVSW